MTTLAQRLAPIRRTEQQQAEQRVRSAWARSFLRHAERFGLLRDLTADEITRACQLRDEEKEPLVAARIIDFERWN